MRASAVIHALGPMDARTIARDSMMRWMVVLGPCFGLLYRFGLPLVTRWLAERFEFDLTPYHPLILSCVAVIAAGFMGAIIGFLLLDQRDEQTLPALLVTPLSLNEYLRYRLAVPTALSIVLTAIMFPLAGVTRLGVVPILVIAATAAPLAPLYTLLMGAFASNKVQGLALAKAAGVLFIPAIVAYFVPMPWQVGLGVVPHYWPLKVFWLFDEGSAGAAWSFAAVGIAYQSSLVWLLARRFARVVHR